MYRVGRQALVAHTTEGREVRITAKQDLRTGEYRAEYERRATLRSGGNEYRVWALTPAHTRFSADDPQTCLQEAIRNVNKLHLY